MATLRQRILRQLPALGVGLVLGAVAAWLALRAPDPVSREPQASATPAATDPGYEDRVGALLAQVKPGMTRREVEALIGPPGRVDDRQIATHPTTRESVCYVVYYCRPPHLPPGAHLMTVTYDAPAFAPIPPDAPVLEVRGPHVPDDCG